MVYISEHQYKIQTAEIDFEKNVIYIFNADCFDRWAANKILGEPRVYPKYGFIRGAWAQKTMTKNEFIEVWQIYILNPSYM